MSASFQLPPPESTDKTAKIGYIDGLVRESYEDRRQWDEQVDRNLNLQLGRSRLDPVKEGVTPVDFNQIRNVVLTQVTNQAGQTPRTKLYPRAKGSPPRYYLNVDMDIGDVSGALKNILAMIRPECLTPRDPDDDNVEPRPPLPLNPAEKALLDQAVAGKILPPTIIEEVSDRTRTEALQTIYDDKWDECAADFYNREAQFNKTTVGWQFLMYEFDQRRYRHILSNPSHLQVFIGPDCTDVRDAPYIVFVQFLGVNQAKARYPQYAAAIEAGKVSGGQLQGTNNRTPYRIPKVYKSTNFQREMVIIRHAFIRDYPYPMTPDEAVKSGRVMLDHEPAAAPAAPAPDPFEQHTLITTDDLNESTPETPAAETAEGEAPASSPTSPLATPDPDGDADVDGGAAPDPDAASDAAAAPIPPPATASVPMVEVYYLVNPDGTRGDRVEMTDALNWPSRPGIRQLCDVAGQEVAGDHETAFYDLPFAHFVNLPILGTPYGQGEPEALEPMQLALNALLTDIVTYFHFFGTPPVAMPVSVAQKIKYFAEDAYKTPHSERWEIPDDLIKQFGGIDNIIGFLKLPGIPPDFWHFIELLIELIDKGGIISQELQGNSPAGRSGNAIESLQTAALGVINWKSLRSEDAIKWQSRLMLHSILTLIPADVLHQHVPQFSKFVWYEIHRELQGLTVDDIRITVEIEHGTGQQRNERKATSLELYNNGQGPLSSTTLLERFEEDPELERQNKISEAEANLKATAQLQASTGAAAVAAPNADPASAQGNVTAAA